MPLADPASVLVRVARRVYAPTPRVFVDEWADKHRVLIGRAASEPGRWRTSRAPYLRGIMRAATLPGVRHVTFRKASQIGGTEVLYNILGYIIDVDPGPTLLVYPTVQDAREIFRDRLLPTLKETPAIARHISELREDTSGLHIKFDRMDLWVTGSNAASRLRSKPIRWAFVDDADVCAPDTVDELLQRGATFEDFKLFDTGTPSFAGAGVDANLSISTNQRFEVPCVHCGTFQELVFERLRWHGGLGPVAGADRAHLDSIERPGGTWYECRACRGKMFEQHKGWMLERGVWVAEGESPEVAKWQSGKVAKTEVAQGEKKEVAKWQSGKVAKTEVAEGEKKEVAEWQSGKVAKTEVAEGEKKEVAEWQSGKVAKTEAAASSLLHSATLPLPSSPPLPGPSHIGFRISSLYSPFAAATWGRVAREWVAQRGKPSRIWINGVLGLPQKSGGLGLKVDQLRPLRIPVSAGGYRMGRVPSWVLCLVGALDVQGDRVYASVWGFSAQARDSALIHCEIIRSPERTGLVQVDPLLVRPWPVVHVGDTTQRVLKSVRCLVWGCDSGHRTTEVYGAVRRWSPPGGGDGSPSSIGFRGLAYAIKGSSVRIPAGYSQTRIDKMPDGRPIVGGVKLLSVDGFVWKEAVAGRMRASLGIETEDDADPQEPDVTTENTEEHGGNRSTGKESGKSTDAKNGGVVQERDGVRVISSEAPGSSSGGGGEDRVTIGRIFLPENTPDEFLEHMVSEELITESRGRQVVRYWKPRVSGVRNDFWDTAVYAESLAMVVGLNRLGTRRDAETERRRDEVRSGLVSGVSGVSGANGLSGVAPGVGRRTKIRSGYR